ncbi:hypothetical protein ACKWTF_008421 [Chironomus riparius]
MANEYYHFYIQLCKILFSCTLFISCPSASVLFFLPIFLFFNVNNNKREKFSNNKVNKEKKRSKNVKYCRVEERKTLSVNGNKISRCGSKSVMQQGRNVCFSYTRRNIIVSGKIQHRFLVSVCTILNVNYFHSIL